MHTDIAAVMGFDDLYRGSEAFRECFNEMLDAVKALPEGLQERGRSLMYPQLHHACVMGDVELVTALLATGLDPDAYTYTDDDEDQPPLVWLARCVELDSEVKRQIAEALLAAGAGLEEGEPEDEAKSVGDDDFASFLRSKILSSGGG
ncbi:ankyrin repeat domain-containing protein [Stenotrophomonas maltophilia]|nr:ankyrin repeat domain-containing protein [Stenotrophomonas maltophilia]